MQIISALNPQRFKDDFNVILKVWFAELNGPVDFVASPLDVEAHGKELWIRAMAGEYGPVEILERPKSTPPEAGKLIEQWR